MPDLEHPSFRERFEIRFGTLEDAPTIVQHRRAMFTDMGYVFPESTSEMDRRFEQWLEPRLASGEYLHWFAVEKASGKIAAGAAVWIMDWPAGPLNPEKPRPYLLNVYTVPEFRRLGLAKQVVGEAVAWCKAHDYGIMTLHASDEGRGIYESFGFRPTNEMRLIF